MQAQTPAFAFGYFGSDISTFQVLEASAQGGVYLAGRSGNLTSSDSNEITLARVDTLGQILWTRSLDLESRTFVYDVVETPDGGLFFTGTVENASFDLEVWTMRLDAQADTLWTRRYDSLSVEELTAATSVSDGGWLITGQNESDDGLLMKLDSLGTLQWAMGLNELMDSPMTSAVKAVETSPGQYTVLLQHLDNLFASSLARFDANGNLLTSLHYGEPNTMIQLNDLVPLANGAVVVTGSSHGSGIVFQMNAQNQIDWQIQYPGAAVDFRSVKVLPDSTLLVLAQFGVAVTDGFQTIHLNASGQVLSSIFSEITPGAVITNFELGFDNQLYTSGVAGFIGSPNNLYTMLTSSDIQGNGLCGKQALLLSPSPGQLADSLQLIAEVLQGFSTQLQSVLLGTNPLQTNVQCALTATEEAAELSLSCFPNPSSGAIRVEVAMEGIEAYEIEVYDLLGNLVERHTSRSGSAVSVLQGPVAAGMYMVQVRSESGRLAGERVLRW